MVPYQLQGTVKRLRKEIEKCIRIADNCKNKKKFNTEVYWNAKASAHKEIADQLNKSSYAPTAEVLVEHWRNTEEAWRKEAKNAEGNIGNKKMHCSQCNGHADAYKRMADDFEKDL